MEINLQENLQNATEEGVISRIPPNLKNKRCTFQVLTATVGLSQKNKKLRMMLGLEIKSPDTVKVEGVTYQLAGGKPNMCLMLEGQKIQDTLKYMELMGLPFKFDPEDPDQLGKFHTDQAFDALLSSKERKLLQYNEDTGEQDEIKDEDDNVITGGYQWELVNPATVLKKVEMSFTS